MSAEWCAHMLEAPMERTFCDFGGMSGDNGHKRAEVGLGIITVVKSLLE